MSDIAGVIAAAEALDAAQQRLNGFESEQARLTARADEIKRALVKAQDEFEAGKRALKAAVGAVL